jgi:hypothetical protein
MTGWVRPALLVCSGSRISSSGCIANIANLLLAQASVENANWRSGALELGATPVPAVSYRSVVAGFTRQRTWSAPGPSGASRLAGAGTREPSVFRQCLGQSSGACSPSCYRRSPWGSAFTAWRATSITLVSWREADAGRRVPFAPAPRPRNRRQPDRHHPRAGDRRDFLAAADGLKSIPDFASTRSSPWMFRWPGRVGTTLKQEQRREFSLGTCLTASSGFRAYAQSVRPAAFLWMAAFLMACYCS